MESRRAAGPICFHPVSCHVAALHPEAERTNATATRPTDARIPNWRCWDRQVWIQMQRTDLLPLEKTCFPSVSLSWLDA